QISDSLKTHRAAGTLALDYVLLRSCPVRLTKSTMKNAALSVLMVQFCADHAVRTANLAVELRRSEHSDGWRRKVNPPRIPDTRQKCRSKRTCRIHAHAGQRRFQTDVRCDQDPSEDPSQSRKRFTVRHKKNYGHQEKGNGKLCEESGGPTCGAWNGYRVIHGGMRDPMP